MIAWSKTDTRCYSDGKNGGKAFHLHVSLSFSDCLCLCSCSTYASPLSLSLSLCRNLPVALFVCDCVDSRSFMLYFALALSLYLSEVCSLSISLSLSEPCSLAHALSLCISLFDSLSLTVTIPWLEEMGSTRHASTPLLATQLYLPSFACQTLSGESCWKLTFSAVNSLVDLILSVMLILYCFAHVM